jgi:hypothetical protein
LYTVLNDYENRRASLAPLKSTKLLDQLPERIRFMHYSLCTEEAYVYWARAFIRFHELKHPATLGGSEVEALFSWLASSRSVAPSTHKQTLSALLFLYRRVIGMDLPWMTEIGHSRRTRRLPVVLSPDELARSDRQTPRSASPLLPASDFSASTKDRRSESLHSSRRLGGRALRAKLVAAWVKVRLPLLLHHVRNGLLNEPIQHRRYPQQACTPIGFRNLHALDRLGPILPDYPAFASLPGAGAAFDRPARLAPPAIERRRADPLTPVEGRNRQAASFEPRQQRTPLA